MARDWPAKDMAPLIALIDDPRHRIGEDDTYRLSEEQARAILDLRLQRLTALGRDEIGRRVEEARHGDRRLSRHPALARAHLRPSSRTSWPSVKDELRHAAPHPASSNGTPTSTTRI